MSAILLPNPPEFPAGSIEEIVAAADALERAAAQRYRSLAEAMRSVEHEDIADVFNELAREEEQHVLSVEKLAGTLLGGLPAKDVVRWVLPETFGAEEAGPAVLLTPYKALSIAVRSEERAFAFWSYVAANAEFEAVRSLAESMAHQELLHAAKFRAARRKAYRAAMTSRRPSGGLAQPLVLDAVQREAAQMAAETIGLLSAAATRLDQLGDAESAAIVRDIAAATPAPADSPPFDTGNASRLPTAERWKQAGSAAVLFEVEGILERRAERYIELLDRSPDAYVTAELKRLADEALHPVHRVHARLAAVEPALGNLASASPGAHGASVKP
jgi:rubrerythrin